jgi:hypothetical protein
LNHEFNSPAPKTCIQFRNQSQYDSSKCSRHMTTNIDDDGNQSL